MSNTSRRGLMAALPLLLGSAISAPANLFRTKQKIGPVLVELVPGELLTMTLGTAEGGFGAFERNLLMRIAAEMRIEPELLSTPPPHGWDELENVR